jgi:hypothetical protein
MSSNICEQKYEGKQKKGCLSFENTLHVEVKCVLFDIFQLNIIKLLRTKLLKCDCFRFFLKNDHISDERNWHPTNFIKNMRYTKNSRSHYLRFERNKSKVRFSA